MSKFATKIVVSVLTAALVWTGSAAVSQEPATVEAGPFWCC